MAKQQIYNRIVTPELWATVNKDNKLIMEDFLEEYKQRKMKPSTQAQYANDCKIVLVYILQNCANKSILELTKKDFRRFSIWMSEEKGMSNARVNRLMSTVRSMLSFIEEDDEYNYEQNVAKKVKGLPKQRVRNEDEDFFMHYDLIMRTREELLRRGLTKLALLHMMLFDTAGRRNEILQIKKSGLLDGNKTNVVVGKRGKEFALIYMNDTKELIQQYLTERGEDELEELWIMDGVDGKRPASYESIYMWVKKICDIINEMEGTNIDIFPHSYRHSRIECLLQGEDLRIIDPNTNKPKIFTLEEVRVLANHSDTNTTSSYAKDHSSELLDTMFNF